MPDTTWTGGYTTTPEAVAFAATAASCVAFMPRTSTETVEPETKRAVIASSSAAVAKVALSIARMP
ncbi:MAG: hypothetical protein ACO4CU_12665 [Ilumatobacteraceae bacterium]